MMVKAVVMDDLVRIFAAVPEGRSSHLLRALASENGPRAAKPCMPIIELARRIWENGGYGHTGGSADTAEGAELLGGLCWQTPYCDRSW